MRLAMLLSALLLAAAPLAAQDIRTKPVRFAPSATGTVISGRITGHLSVVYTLGAEAGQRMRIRMTADNGAACFNVYEPGRGPGDRALAVSEQTGPMVPDRNVFDGALPASGVYSVSVYLYRAAARRGETATYSLDVSITGATGPTVGGRLRRRAAGRAGFLAGDRRLLDPQHPQHALGRRQRGRARPHPGDPAQSRLPHGRGAALVPGGDTGPSSHYRLGRRRLPSGVGLWRGGAATQLPETPPAGMVAGSGTAERAGRGQFDATGPVQCRQRADQPVRACAMGVARGPGGEATVVVTRPDGKTRTLFFQKGAFRSADTSQADGYPPIRASAAATASSCGSARSATRSSTPWCWAAEGLATMDLGHGDDRRMAPPPPAAARRPMSVAPATPIAAR